MRSIRLPAVWSDLVYIFTQPFAYPAMFGFAIIFTFAPTLVYLTASGLFQSFFTKVFPQCVTYSKDVWTLVLYGHASSVRLSRLARQDKQPWLSVAVGQCRRGLREDGDSLLKVVWHIINMLMGVLGCAAMAVGTPVIAAAILVLGPTAAVLACLIHVNLKLSLFPAATRALYALMLHERPPDAQTTRSINLAFLAEIACESAPQFLLLVANEVLLSSSRPPSLVVVSTLVSSGLALASNAWPFIFWSFRLGSIRHALHEVIYVITNEHLAIVNRRKELLKGFTGTRKELVQMQRSGWQRVVTSSSDAANTDNTAQSRANDGGGKRELSPRATKALRVTVALGCYGFGVLTAALATSAATSRDLATAPFCRMHPSPPPIPPALPPPQPPPPRECMDSPPGTTGFLMAGNPTNCVELAAYCTNPVHGVRISASCPVCLLSWRPGGN